MEDENTVQKLTKQFEQLSDNLISSTIENGQIPIRKCNWWLEENMGNINEAVENNEFNNENVEEEIISNEKYNISNNAIIQLNQQANSDIFAFHVIKIIEELHQTEQSYIETISKGYDNYICVFDDPNIPNSLRGQKHKLFSTLERIRNLHQEQIWPFIEQCEQNVEDLCKAFHQFCEDDLFYIYIQYAINKKLSDEICEKNKEYFKEHQEKVNDKLGILSIFVQPIQRLPRYKLLLLNLLETLLKQIETDSLKQQIAWCCKAEKNMSRLLDTFNESMSINDINECNDVNVMHQGKFYKATDFDMLDPAKRPFRGRIFVFDRCIICTEIMEKNSYLYRGYFQFIDLCLEYKGKSKFKIYTRQKYNKKWTFFHDFIVVQSTMGLFETIKAQAVENHKRKSSEVFRNSIDRPNSSLRSSSDSTSSTTRSSNSSGNSDKVFLSPSQDYSSIRSTVWYGHE